jgi:hypothetical protein
MNYLKAYCKLIRKEESKGLTKKQAKQQGLYVEGHHIFPQCLYGKTRDGNNRIVYVSARVHYILHALLEKAFIKRYGVEHPKTIKMTFAHIMLKGHDIHEKYINSHLYDKARKRHAKNISGVKKSDEMRMKLRKSKKGKYLGRESSGAIPIRIYFDDGKVMEYLDGIHNFSNEYNYALHSLKRLRDKKITHYKNIIEIEKLPKLKKEPKIKEYRVGRKIHNTIPIRIYFADGRVLEYPDGALHFAKNNPNYDHSTITRMRKGLALIHKDIVKVEEIIESDDKEILPIMVKYLNTNAVPIKVYFNDGKIIEELDGAEEFCRKYKNYTSSNIRLLSRNKIKRYKDIVKVERLRSKTNVLF